MKFVTPREGADYRMDHGFPVVKPQRVSMIGTRGPDTQEIVLRGTRIVCLGCSFTYGYTSRDEDTYPALMELQLPNGCRVLNMGRRNYGLKLCTDWYEAHCDFIEPRIVVLQLPDFARQPFPELQPDEPIYYTANFGSRQAVLSAEPRDTRRVASAMLELMRRDLARLALLRMELLSQNVELIVLLYQGAYGRLEMFAEEYFRQARRALRQMDVPIVDGPEMSWRFMEKHGLLADKSHPNLGGNFVIAQRVGMRVKESLRW